MLNRVMEKGMVGFISVLLFSEIVKIFFVIMIIILICIVNTFQCNYMLSVKDIYFILET